MQGYKVIKMIKRNRDGITYVAMKPQHGFPVRWVPYHKAIELIKMGDKLATKNEVNITLKGRA